MKREKFIRELLKSGCEFHRHGGRHDIYVHLASGKKTAVPRHPEIKDDLCKLIRRQLGLG